MIFEQGAFFALILAAASSLALLITQNWRRSIIALCLLYVAVFWLVAISLPTGIAIVKLIVGWMSGAVLGASHYDTDLVDERYAGLAGRMFRVLAILLVWIVVYSITPGFVGWLAIKPVILWGGLILIGSGLLQLGMTTLPLRVILGLLMMVAGFEVIYSAVEKSILVTGLLAAINMGLAMIGAYLLTASGLEKVN